MSSKKLFAIILSAVILTSAVTIGAYKIFSKKSEAPSLTNSGPNLESIVDSIDYSENLLDSNAVYKEKFDEDLNSQGKWIPVKSSDLIRELTSPPSQDEPPAIQNVSNEPPVETNPETTIEDKNTSVARNMAPSSENQVVQEEEKTNVSSENVKQETETKVVEKIVYIWQPNECSGSSWNPYTNGHWEFTYAGWVWASDYRWGRHCYNYGRWVWTSFYGWVWMPGGRWAPNWVTWRTCYYNGGCYIGWYPTCPRLYWRDYHSNLIVCNSHFTSNPHHWTIVNQVNITKTVTNITKLPPTKNSEILNNSTKTPVNVLAVDDTKIKYSGPNVTQINNVTKSTITPKTIEVPVTKGETNTNGTKQTVVSEPGTKNNTTRTIGVIDPNGLKSVANINPTRNPEVPTTPVPPIKPEKTNPNTTKSITTSTTKTDPTTKADPPVKSVTPPTKSTTTPKGNTPKQNPTTKQDPPKQNPPTKQDPPKQNPPPKYDPPKQNPPPKYEPPVYNPPPTKQDPPRQDPPRQDPPKQNPPPPPPPRQDPPKQDPPKQEPKGK
jgi:hypothetical protein